MTFVFRNEPAAATAAAAAAATAAADAARPQWGAWGGEKREPSESHRRGVSPSHSERML